MKDENIIVANKNNKTTYYTLNDRSESWRNLALLAINANSFLNEVYNSPVPSECKDILRSVGKLNKKENKIDG